MRTRSGDTEATAARLPVTDTSITEAPEPVPWRKRIGRILAWLLGLALLFFVLNALGISISSWLKSLWEAMKEISIGYIVAGCFFETLMIAFTGYAWFAILRAAYPNVKLSYWSILTAYSVSVAMGSVVPANVGRLMLLFMLIAIIPGATFTSVFAASLVEKIFFTVIVALVCVYLFLAVPGSASIQLGNITNNKALSAIVIAVVIVGVALLIRLCWRWVKKLWIQVKQGGAILQTPGKYFTQVVFPSFLSWLCKLTVIGIFLAAYSIPVTFHSVMTVFGGNSLASITSVTPGGVGINQAINTATLSKQGVSATTATAYSTSQQLITTAWNVAMAIVLVAIFWGWSGGKALVRTSYDQAKEKSKEIQEEHKQTKLAEQEAKEV